jgi:hypothetical protein
MSGKVQTGRSAPGKDHESEHLGRRSLAAVAMYEAKGRCQGLCETKSAVVVPGMLELLKAGSS